MAFSQMRVKRRACTILFNGYLPWNTQTTVQLSLTSLLITPIVTKRLDVEIKVEALYPRNNSPSGIPNGQPAEAISRSLANSLLLARRQRGILRQACPMSSSYLPALGYAGCGALLRGIRPFRRHLRHRRNAANFPAIQLLLP